MTKEGFFAEVRKEHRERTSKGVLKNRHEREFYNFCFDGRRRTVEENVEFWTSLHGKISTDRAIEIATMADEARDESKPVGNLFAYCLVR